MTSQIAMNTWTRKALPVLLLCLVVFCSPGCATTSGYSEKHDEAKKGPDWDDMTFQEKVGVCVFFPLYLGGYFLANGGGTWIK